MPSKRGLLLVLLFGLAQADPVSLAKSISLSFGPPATHSIFNTAPLNPRDRPFGNNPNDQKSVLAFAGWYIENVLKCPTDSWLVTETGVRQDASTGVWRVDVRQLAHNGTIEIVDGNISLNILNGEVISYGDSFYRGPPPDLTTTSSDVDEFGEFVVASGPQYNLQAYCRTTSQFSHHQWMQENPKWRDWYNRLSKPKTARDHLFELRSQCSKNIQRAYDQCIQERLAASAPTSWFQKAQVWFQREIMHDYSSTAHVYGECSPLARLEPLDLSTPSPFKVATTYDENTCTWNFITDFSTASVYLHSLQQSHCKTHPQANAHCEASNIDYLSMDMHFDINSRLQQVIRLHKSELTEREGIVDPALAILFLLVSFPHGESEAFREVNTSPETALANIETLRRPESGPYVFELNQVPGADGSVNATIVYVQTPPRQSTGFFDFEDDDEESVTRPTSSLIPAWKLSILFKNGRRFDGYVEAGNPGALIRLLDLSGLQTQPQGVLSSLPPEVVGALSVGEERGESCFGWGESAAIREGVKQFVGGLEPDRSKTGPPSKEGAKTKPPTYRSLKRSIYWGIERMGRVWADILSSVNQTVTAHTDEGTSEDEVAADSNSSDGALEARTTPQDRIMTSLIPASLALLPCNPTFLMARDALIQADQLIFGGNHKCDLWRGFAERGLGVSAHGPAEMMWTPWGGGKRTDGFDPPADCPSIGAESTKANAMKNKRDEL
ncbi:Fungalysin/Thermolysin Extracellular metalloproteinase 5 [Tulasnella sp. 408]|nr:Fungalysin/Thermolysin Extracellular metalloproteinase 5 [Tulasnella sp. 408]